MMNIVSFLVVALCVAVLIVALSLSNGFEKSLVDKIILAAPHVTLSGNLDDLIIPDRQMVKSIDDMAQVQSLLMNADADQVQGILLRGTSGNDFLKSFSRTSLIVDGNYPSVGQVIVGNKLAENLGIRTGDLIKILTGPAIAEEFEVSGIFKAGLYDFDSNVVLARYDDVLSFTPDEGEGVAAKVVKFRSLRLNNPLMAKSYAENLLLVNPDLVITNWQDDNKTLFNAIAMEKQVIFIVLLLLVMAVSVAIANSQFIQLIAQREQIAILTAMGFKRKQILFTFLLEGFMVGVVGATLGIVISLLGIHYLSTCTLSLPIDIYQVDHIPIEFKVVDMFKTTMAAIVLVCLSSIVPAFYAAKLDPVEVLRKS